MNPTQHKFAAASHQIKGARDYQEDSTRIFWPEHEDHGQATPGSVVAVLCDGMGGHVCGEVASNLACDHWVQHFTEVGDTNGCRLEDSVIGANDALAQAVASNRELSGMGCTLVAAALDPDGLRFASVGDSSLFVFRNGLLHRLNEDHSMGALLDKQAEANIITHEEARRSPNRHGLRSAMTGQAIPLINIERVPQKLHPGDWILLASDGIDSLSGDEIATIVNMHREESPKEMTEKLLDAVEQKKVHRQDNTSIIAVRVERNEDVAPPDKKASNGAASSDDTEILVGTTYWTVVGKAKEAPRRATATRPDSHIRTHGQPAPNVKRSPIVMPVILVFVAACAVAAYLIAERMFAVPTTGGENGTSALQSRPASPKVQKNVGGPTDAPKCDEIARKIDPSACNPWAQRHP